VVTHESALAQRVRRLGADPELAARPLGAHEGQLALPYALSELHAALGASQLKKLAEFLEARREIAARYLAELRGFELPHPGGLGAHAERGHAWGRFVIRCASAERDALVLALRGAGVEAAQGRPPAGLEGRFRGRGHGWACPQASAYARSALTLPIHPTLCVAEQTRVLTLLAEWRRRGEAA
jgi:dTDP-4-amino-4,6-dideoxygalactose transaminase